MFCISPIHIQISSLSLIAKVTKAYKACNAKALHAAKPTTPTNCKAYKAYEPQNLSVAKTASYKAYKTYKLQSLQVATPTKPTSNRAYKLQSQLQRLRVTKYTCYKSLASPCNIYASPTSQESRDRRYKNLSFGIRKRGPHLTLSKTSSKSTTCDTLHDAIPNIPNIIREIGDPNHPNYVRIQNAYKPPFRPCPFPPGVSTL